jgi:3-deoxy-D-manno-octulosonic-acid transferase
VAYLPFDLGFAVRRFFERYRPGALVLVEGDYWPLVLTEARRRGVPVAVVNGRVGDRSFGRMTKLAPLARRLLMGADLLGVQDPEDRRRLIRLGVPGERVQVTGNIKYDAPEPVLSRELAALADGLSGGRRVLVAGSTMPGEEEQVLEAFEAAGGGERALLVLAPRHPERWQEVDRLLAAWCAARGTGYVRRSVPASPYPAVFSVLLLDSLGELAGLYRLAAAAFVGGTLVDTGGHNPLEAARFGVPIAAGPSMRNFRDMAERFGRAGAWRRVANAAELGAAWREWLDDPEESARQGGRARALVQANRGALGRTLDLLAPILAMLPPPPDPAAMERALSAAVR